MDVGALRQVLKRFKQWRRLEDDVKMLTESGGAPIGRVLTTEEQETAVQDRGEAIPNGSTSTALPSSRRTPPCEASK